jgi:hypothetical protein
MTSSIIDHSNSEMPSDGPPGPPARAPRARVSPLATLMVGLIVGLSAGYLAHPWLAPIPPRPAVAAQAGAADPTAPTPASMDSVIAQTRQFKGDANAPVTIIEFGDFQ